VTAAAPPRAPESVLAAAVERPSQRAADSLRRALRRPAAAAAVLVGVYLVLIAACDPHGQLGGDTGARVATLRAMAEGNWPHPDLGYWAARLDPTGRLHPMWFAGPIGGHWVTVGTIPTLLAGYPLFRLAGYRGLLVLPIVGALLAAFAARRLARRLGSASDGWAAFWTVGLASPLAIYALDYWDHALGLGLMLSGVAALVDLVEVPATERWRTRPLARGAVAGLAFGAAATLRTEAFVFGAVTAVVIAVVLVTRRRWRAVVEAGTAMAVTAGACLVLNAAAERAVLGASLRTGRATGTLQSASDLGVTARLRLAFLTGGSLRPPVGPAIYGEAAVFALAVAAAIWLFRRGDRERATGSLILAFAVLLVRLAGGLSYVPGVLAATPLAIAGLVLGWRSRGGARLLVIALLGYAAVIATQFPEVLPNGYQWGGRYLMLSGALAAIVGVTAIERLDRRALTGVTALAVVVTGFGVAFLVQRTHHVAAWTSSLTERPESVLISRSPYAFRDAGAAYTPESRWLLAVEDADVQVAFDVAEASGADTVGLIQERSGPATPIVGWCRGTSDLVPWDSDPAVITHYDRAGPDGCPGVPG
jgi:hypothetical protein